MILLYDNYDSFTYNLLDYLQQGNAFCKVIRNDQCNLEEIATWDLSGIVISPGPGKPTEAGNLMDLIHSFYNKIPILGVCLGHQAIGEFFGARLVSAPKPMHGKTSIITHTDHAMFVGIPSTLEVMRYHSLILKNIPGDLKIIAQTENDEIMAIAHSVLPIWGVQFHPESILSQYGLTLINNWLSVVVNFKK